MTALVLGGLACVGTLLATVRVRHPPELGFVYLMIGWPIGELAVFHAVLQTAAAAWLIHGEALDHGSGVVGIGLFAVSVVGLVAVQRRAGSAAHVFRAALDTPIVNGAAGLPVDWNPTLSPPKRSAWMPFRFDHHGVEVIRNIRYGEHPKRNVLDVYRPAGTSVGSALPVIIFVHGGGWVIGNKQQQGKPMLVHLARRGYLGVTINYRLAPRHRWPAQIVDVKRAIAWVHEHIAEFGGDPSFIAISGASAGGHLSALAALTPGDAGFQPGFEQADTRVDACIPIYAPFDFTDRSSIRRRAALRRFLEPLVMTTRFAADEVGWRAASPVWRIGPEAPPMFVIQGSNDTLVWREESHDFVDELAKCTTAPLVFVVVPGAQHAFDVFNSVRSRAAVDAIARFLDAVRVGVHA